MRKKTAFISGLLFSVFLLGLYIFQLNSLTGLAWHIGETEQRVAQLKAEIAQLQAGSSLAFSLADLEHLAQQRNFQKVSSIIYLRIPSGPVAQN